MFLVGGGGSLGGIVKKEEEGKKKEKAVTGCFCKWKEEKKTEGQAKEEVEVEKYPGAEMSPAGDVAVATRSLDPSPRHNARRARGGGEGGRVSLRAAAARRRRRGSSY